MATFTYRGISYDPSDRKDQGNTGIEPTRRLIFRGCPYDRLTGATLHDAPLQKVTTTRVWFGRRYELVI